MTEQQWLKIYRETVHPVYGYTAKRTGGNRELAEDIVQESYLRALHDWKRKSVPDSPVAWLKRVARNLLIDYLRQRKWEGKDDVAIKSHNGFKTSGDQFESLELMLAVSSMGRKKARVIEAFYYDGKSVKEIANELRISERAVEGQLRRARQSLKSLLPDSNSNGGYHE